MGMNHARRRAAGDDAAGGGAPGDCEIDDGTAPNGEPGDRWSGNDAPGNGAADEGASNSLGFAAGAVTG